jgi:hypothetical protein
VANLRIVSITPSVTQAKVGDTVSFTAVAENDGPDAVEMWQEVGSDATITCAWNTTAEGCVEGGVAQPGDTATITGTETVPPATGSFSDTACAWSPELDNPPTCKTATISVDPQPCPLSIPGATQTLGGETYTLEGEDTFTKDAPLGSFAQSASGIADANALPVVYTGDHGMGWTEYADGWQSTWSAHGYQPSTVQSVHDGVLDFYLHPDLNAASAPVGASISPLPDGNRYQTYGAWSFCERAPVDGGLPGNGDGGGYHQAPLLWPDNDTNTDWKFAESDFPEADLGPGPPDFRAYAHYGGQGAQDQYDVATALAVQDPLYDPNAWHVYTQTWGPRFRSYYVDGYLVATSTDQVWSGPERWQLQIEPAQNDPSAYAPGYGHVYVNWVWIGTPSS